MVLPKDKVVQHITVPARLTHEAPLSAVEALLVVAVTSRNEGHIVTAKWTQLDIDLLLVSLSAVSVDALHR